MKSRKRETRPAWTLESWPPMIETVAIISDFTLLGFSSTSQTRYSEFP